MTINANTVASNKLELTGRLFDTQGQLIEKGKFHVYDETGNFLAYGKTSADGKFSIEIPQPVERASAMPIVFHRCIEEKLASVHPEIRRDPLLAKDLSFIKERREVEKTVCKIVPSISKLNLGSVVMEETFEDEKVPLSYLLHIAQAVIPATITSGIENIKEALDFFDTHGVADVLKAYGIKEVPLTAENTWKLVTNGICPIYFKKEGHSLVAEVNWDEYDFDRLESLPNVRVFFSAADTKNPDIERIEVQFRKTLKPSSQNQDKTAVQIFRPSDENFSTGLRLANCAFHVFGQTVYHLALGHVYGAKVSQAVHDYLQGTKLGELLLPHCQFIRKISNDLGKTAIFGEDGILNVSALSVNGIGQLIRNSLAALDPFSFKPRKSMSEEHSFAEMQNLHYHNVRAGVHEYFDAHWDEIVADWKSVHAFFLKMHKSSPAYRPWAGEELEKAGWQDSSEIGGHPHPMAPPRTKYNNTDIDVRAMRHIARNPNKPEEGDRELCELFFTDFIHRVTGYHSWLHRSQYLESDISPHVADVNFTPITVGSFGEGVFGGIKEDEANSQLKIIKIFKGFSVAKYALCSSDRVYKGLVDRIVKAREQYLQWGIDPLSEIQVSTVI